MSVLSSLSGVKRKSDLRVVRSAYDPKSDLSARREIAVFDAVLARLFHDLSRARRGVDECCCCKTGDFGPYDLKRTEDFAE
jgi:hypothetical protein